METRDFTTFRGRRVNLFVIPENDLHCSGKLWTGAAGPEVQPEFAILGFQLRCWVSQEPWRQPQGFTSQVLSKVGTGCCNLASLSTFCFNDNWHWPTGLISHIGLKRINFLLMLVVTRCLLGRSRTEFDVFFVDVWLHPVVNRQHEWLQHKLRQSEIHWISTGPLNLMGTESKKHTHYDHFSAWLPWQPHIVSANVHCSIAWPRNGAFDWRLSVTLASWQLGNWNPRAREGGICLSWLPGRYLWSKRM